MKTYDIRLEKGDCLDVMDKLIAEGVKVDVIIADIPYDEVSKLGEERAKYKGQLRKIDKEQADILTFDINKMCINMDKIGFGSAYVFVGINQIQAIYNYFKYDRKKDYMCRLITWHKNNPSPSNGQHMFLSASEYVIFIKRRRASFYGHCEHNVVNFSIKKSKLHPTEKPQDLLEYFLNMSTKDGDVVLDFCMGSGSTGIACKNLNRNFIGIELDENYFNIAKERIEKTYNINYKRD